MVEADLFRPKWNISKPITVIGKVPQVHDLLPGLIGERRHQRCVVTLTTQCPHSAAPLLKNG